MKKLHLLLLGLTICLFTACHDKLWDAIDGLDSRVTKLEELCKEMNTNITSLQTIVDVLQSNDFIAGVVEIKKDGEVIGYTITFGKHDPITIYHGQDGKDGADGKDGQNGSANAPVIGVAQDTDGVYYWTLNGEWLLDDNGNKLPVSGKDGQNGVNGTMPQLKIEEGYWYVSYDNGITWTQLGKATGEDGQNGDKGDKGDIGDSMFQSVTQDENYVYFTLADGTVIMIAKDKGKPDGDAIINFKDLAVKSALLQHSPNIDINNDGEISYKEATELYGGIKIKNSNIYSFKELQYFTNITSCHIESDNLFELQFPEGLDSIIYITCSNLKCVNIPRECKYIGSKAFSTAENTHFIFNDSLKYIDNGAFGTYPRTFNLPRSVVTIKDKAIYIASKEFTFPENLIGDPGGIRLLDSVETVYWNAINFDKDYYLESSPTTYAFYGVSMVKGTYTKDGYTYYHYHDENIKRVIFGEQVETLPNYLCSYLDSLKEVNIPDNVQSLGDGCFRGCRNLKKVTIGNGVSKIGNAAFEWCESLTTLDIGKNVTEIGNQAFWRCHKLQYIYCRAKNPPILLSSYVFTDEIGIIYVPRASVAEYRALWSDFADKIVGYDF